jgi:predicted amidohydrolase
MLVNVALVQLEVSTHEDIASRTSRTVRLIEEAALHADVVMLPELWHVGAFDIPAAQLYGERIDGSLVTLMRESASAHGIWLHAGSFAERDSDGNLYNTSVLIDPNGELVATYRKVHLFGFDSGEAAALEGGTNVVIGQTVLGTTGLSTCYDLRFPELFRILVQKGATAVIVSSGWPQARIEAWDVLVRARAIENQSWVFACNEIGTQGQVVLGGHSQIVDPQGEVIAKAGDEECILYASIDPELPIKIRADFPVLRDIRIDTSFTS